MSKTAHFPQNDFYLNYVAADVDRLGIYFASKIHGERISKDIRM